MFVLESRRTTSEMAIFQSGDAKRFRFGHLAVPRTCWIKHPSHAQGSGAERARVCRHEAPYPSLGPGEFSLDAFYTPPPSKKTPALTSYLWPVARAATAAAKINLCLRLLPWIPAEQTNGPKQYYIYHISITLNASVSILHCPRHTHRLQGTHAAARR